MPRSDLLKGLTKEQIEKANNCQNVGELLNLAKQEGVELNEEQLNAVSGGCGTTTKEPAFPKPQNCPFCGGSNVTFYIRPGSDCIAEYRCNDDGVCWNSRFKWD